MTAPCPPPSVGTAGWRRDVWFLAAGVFLTIVSFSMVLPFLPLYLKEMGVTRGVETWAGLIYGASFLSGGLMAPVWGSLGDRFGQKAMVLRSGVAIALVKRGMARKRFMEPDGTGWEFEFVLLVAALTLAVAGAGQVALDPMIGL